MKRLAALIPALAVFGASVVSVPAWANVTRDLKRLTGYTIVYGGHVAEVLERNTEKLLRLDNGWLFRLELCLVLGPLPLSDVVVLGKRFPEELLKKNPQLPAHLQYHFKLIVDRDVCDASMTR